MADNKKKTSSKELAKSGDDVFNVVKLIANADPPKVDVPKTTKDGKLACQKTSP